MCSELMVPAGCEKWVYLSLVNNYLVKIPKILFSKLFYYDLIQITFFLCKSASYLNIHHILLTIFITYILISIIIGYYELKGNSIS